jgi:ABC-type uncharacterized transport system involved in gliding motility auxiliary subunit
MKATLDRTTPYLPWVGLLLLVAGFIVTAITRRFELVNNLLLGIGALLLLSFALLRPDDVRRLATGRQARYGTSTVLSILFFAAIAILIYWLAYQNEDWRLDLTETGEFSIAPETEALLDQLDEPIHIIGFYTVSSQQRLQARTVLENLTAASDKITYEFQDPEANPLLAQQYELNFYDTLVFIKNQDQPDEVFAKANGLTDTDIHTALLKVTNPVAKKLYFVTGHGEPDIAAADAAGMGTVVGLLEDQGFSVDTLNLVVAGTVPDDATVVAVIKPQVPLSPGEANAIGEYLDGGGAAVIAGDVPLNSAGLPEITDDPLIDYLGATWGLTLRADVIIERVMAAAGQSLGVEFVAADYGTSPIITSDLRQFGTLFSIARSIASEAIAGVTQTNLVLTSPDAWGETDLTALAVDSVAEPNETDAQGNLVVAASAENQTTGARVVLFGDGDFVTNSNLVMGGNSRLFTNALNWLADDEVAIELAPRETVQRQITIPDQQLRILRLISVWLGPVLMAFIGLAVWMSRRRTA